MKDIEAEERSEKTDGRRKSFNKEKQRKSLKKLFGKKKRIKEERKEGTNKRRKERRIE